MNNADEVIFTFSNHLYYNNKNDDTDFKSHSFGPNRNKTFFSTCESSVNRSVNDTDFYNGMENENKCFEIMGIKHLTDLLREKSKGF